MFGPLPEKLTLEMQKAVLDAVRLQVPALRTQAQYNAFIAGFDAFRYVLNSIFEGNKEREVQARQALELAFDIAQKVTLITEQLKEVPDSSLSSNASIFTQAPVELQEHDLQKTLLSELSQIESLEELNAWYNATPNKERRDRIVSQDLRNVFIDSIRERKATLGAKG